MTLARALLVVLAACTTLVVVVRDWRPALVFLVGVALAMAGFLWEEARRGQEVLVGSGIGLLVAIDLTTAATVVLILLTTGLSYSRDFDVAERDELGLPDRWRAIKQAIRLPRPARPVDYLFPVLAVALVLAATLLLPHLYPYPARDVDYAWTFLLLSGILALVIADSMLKIGLGLLMLAFGVKLFYLAVAARIGLIELVLLNLVTIIAALIVAILSALLYGRAKTLDLETLYRE